MRLRLVARVLALVCLIVSLFMLLPMIYAGTDGTDDLRAFAASLTCGLTFSFFLFMFGWGGTDYQALGIREALAVVSLSWVIATFVGALPYFLSDVIPDFTDAFFEAMSGFTTTGATIMTNIEAAPRGILFWRSLTHWLGGMGIVVLSLAVLPFLGVGGMELYKAEVPGPAPEKLTPRVQQTALYLWAIYVLLTALSTVMLMLGEMNFFDAINHSFSTIATGGFSTKNASIGHYNSPYIEWVTTFFMFVSGANFSLHYFLLTGGWRKALRDDEFRLYAKIVGISSFLIALMLLGRGYYVPVGEAFRKSLFHVVSLMTSSGFVTTDYDLWPHFARLLLLLLIFSGACAGSTSGGMTVMRVLILLRQIHAELQSILHPRAVLRTRVNGRVISRNSLSSVTAFFMLYMVILGVGVLAVTAFGHDKLDILTALSGVIASLSNIGPGLNDLGPTQTYAWLPAGVKWIFCFCMLAGRLELYAMVLLFLPGTWKR